MIFIKDYYYGAKTIEQAESKMQKTVLNNLINKEKPDVILSSDLTNQLTASALGAVDSNIPHMGFYSACASFSSILMTLGSFIMSKHIKKGICLISSHCLAAEKQFRFPVNMEHLNQKKFSNSNSSNRHGSK